MKAEKPVFAAFRQCFLRLSFLFVETESAFPQWGGLVGRDNVLDCIHGWYFCMNDVKPLDEGSPMSDNVG